MSYWKAVCPPPNGSGPPPKSTAVPKYPYPPVSTMLLAASNATARHDSPAVPPKRLAQRTAPLGANFATKMSEEPALGIGPAPKSTVPINVPTTTMLLLLSNATPFAMSCPSLPMRLDQICAPVEPEYLAINRSAPLIALGTEVRFPPPKSTVCLKEPTTITSPLRSSRIATGVASSQL